MRIGPSSIQPAMFSNLSANQRFLILIMPVFLTALAVRILCAWPALQSPERLTRLDSATYYQPAQSLWENHRVMNIGPDSDLPAVQRPPGYIYFLAVVGGRQGEPFSIVPAAVAGCLVDALTVFLAALTGRALAGRRAGFWAAVLYALNLTALANAPLILADSLLGFLCAWQVFFLVRAWRTKRLSDFLFGAVFAALAALTKPVNLPVFLVLIPFVLAPVIFRSWKKAVSAILLTALVFSALLLPWMIRNQLVGAGFVLDRNSGLTARHNTAAILARVNGTDIDTERAALEAEAEAEAAFPVKPGGAFNTFEREMEQDSWYLARYRKTIFEHPGAAAATHLFQVWILLPDLPNFLQNLGLRTGERGTLAVLRRDGPVAAFRHYMGGSYSAAFLAMPFLLATGALYALTAAGVWIYLRRRRWAVLTLFAVFVLYYLAVPGPVLMPRYQIPALPFACEMAGAVISVCGIRRWRKRRSCPRCNP